MRPDLHVGTLTVAGTRHARDPRGLVIGLGLEPAPGDRRVLLVRRLRVSADAPGAARRLLAELWTTAPQPARGPVDERAPAVQFSDEAEALACLSADVLAGTASHWWWRRRLPRHTVAVADTLATLWLAEPRWVPAALAHVHRISPARCVATLDALPEPVVRDLLRAVVAEHLPDLPSPACGSAVAPAGASAVPTSHRPATDAGGEGTDRSTNGRTISGTSVATDPDLPTPTVAEVLLQVALTLAERPAEARTERFAAWLAAPTSPEPPDGPAVHTESAGPVEPAESSGDAVPTSEHRPARRPRAPAAPPPAVPTDPERAWRHRPWDASGPAVPTELATLLYAVNLVELFDLGRLANGSTGWAVVESVGRWLLRDLPSGQRRALLADPLFPLLTELDTRPPGVRNPVRLGTAVRPVRHFLRDHHLSAATFTRPGSVVVSRTHVDVVLGLDEIDIDVRVAGLDRDPGWVPDLGRIVLFHFDGSDQQAAP